MTLTKRIMKFFGPDSPCPGWAGASFVALLLLFAVFVVPVILWLFSWVILYPILTIAGWWWSIWLPFN